MSINARQEKAKHSFSDAYTPWVSKALISSMRGKAIQNGSLILQQRSYICSSEYSDQLTLASPV